MRTIIVDDEPMMIKSFQRLSSGVAGLESVVTFNYPEDALDYAKDHDIELAILDIEMPGMNGLELAGELKKIRGDILIVFITAYEDYIREANQLKADYYIVKPYKKEVIEHMASQMLLLSKRQRKEVYVQTFGRFLVTKNGKPVPITGKAKEILALIVSRLGKEISNEEIYSTIWEDREYSNIHMKVYYNALKRLKDRLQEAGLDNLIISTTRGQIANIEAFDCDYYDWMHDNQRGEVNTAFTGEFLTEYSWGEELLADMMFNGLLN